jgi:hypothetical protein
LYQWCTLHAYLSSDKRRHRRRVVTDSVAVIATAEVQQETAKSVILPTILLRLTLCLAALALIFSIGLIPVLASTMRLCEIVMSGSPVTDGKSWQDGDSSWYDNNAGAYSPGDKLTRNCRTWAWVPIWGQIEVDIGIVVASLPSLNPLMKKFWGGASKKRSLTPSQLPDFPEYQECWSLQEPSSPDLEKSFKASEISFYDETSDVEDEIDVAKTTAARMAAARPSTEAKSPQRSVKDQTPYEQIK